MGASIEDMNYRLHHDKGPFPTSFRGTRNPPAMDTTPHGPTCMRCGKRQYAFYPAQCWYCGSGQ